LSGSIVAFLDADDWWAKGKLSAVNEVFEANPTLAAVGHGFFEVHDLEPPREKIVSGQNVASIYPASILRDWLAQGSRFWEPAASRFVETFCKKWDRSRRSFPSARTCPFSPAP
jgi:hypothetical protein